MFAELLRAHLGGIELPEAQIEAFEAHYHLMVRWNKALNLTKITEMHEAIERHYVESLFLGAHLPTGSWRIADVGSGPGFPGFPVAVLRPECQVTLIESHQRKAVFLREATRGMANVKVLAIRADKVEEKFDWVVSRAVSYDDLAVALPRLALSAALLTGTEEPPSEWAYEWETAIAVPGGMARFLRIGRSLGKLGSEAQVPADGPK